MEREDEKPLAGLVQVDDEYFGGVRDGKRGRGAEGKTPFVAAARTLPCRDEWIGWRHPPGLASSSSRGQAVEIRAIASPGRAAESMK